MKAKLMTKHALAAAVACAAVGARAEYLYWTISGVTSTEDKPMSSGNPYVAYIFNNSSKNLDDIKAKIENRESVASLALKTTTSTTGSFSTNSDRYGWFSGTFTAFAIILNAPTLDEATAYMVATKSGKSTVTSKSCSSTGTATEVSFGSQSSNSWVSIASIPEPTSGVLLLVGVAALALRRKNAA